MTFTRYAYPGLEETPRKWSADVNSELSQLLERSVTQPMTNARKSRHKPGTLTTSRKTSVTLRRTNGSVDD
jgi:hypothetical protein